MTPTTIERIRTTFVTVVLAASGIVLLLLPLAALRWAQLPFPGFVLDPNLVVNDTGETGWAGRQVTPPVAYPERVTAVDGAPVPDLAAYQQELARRSLGEAASITLTQPQGSRIAPAHAAPERSVTVTLNQLTAVELWNQFWLLYLAGFFVWLIGAWTFKIRPHEEAAQIFALFTSFGALGMAALFDLVTTQYVARLWLLSLSVVGGLSVWLSAVFPHPTRIVNQQPWLKWLLLIPGVLVGVWGQLWLYDTVDPWAYVIPWRTLFLLAGLSLLVTLGMMVYRGFFSRSTLVRQQGRIILAGSILAFAPIIFFFLAAAVATPLDWFPPTLYIPPLVIFPFSIGYTIVRFRLLNVDVGLRRGLVYTVLTAVLVGVFTLVLTGVTAAFGPVLTNPLIIAILIALVALVFNPLRDFLQTGIDQVLFSQPVAFDELLRAYNRALTTAVNIDQVANVLLEYVQKGLPYAEVRLYLPDAGMSGYSSYGNDSKAWLSASSPLVEFMRQQVGAIDLAEERAWPDTFRQHWQAVQALQATIIIPINNGRELLGWLGLSRPEFDHSFSQYELSYLSALAEQGLIGLERANVVQRLEARIAELDLLGQFSQRINFTIELDDLLELVFVHYQRLLGIDDFFVSLTHPETGQVYCAFYLQDGERFGDREGVDEPVTDTHVLEAIKTGQMMLPEDKDGRSWIVAPLNAGADTLGAIHTFYRHTEQRFRSRQQQLVSVFADLTAVALQRLRTSNELQEHARQLEIINQVTHSLVSTIELDPLLELILDKAMELLDTEAGTLMVMEDNGELEFRVARGPVGQNLIGERLPLGVGLAGTAAQTGRPVLVNRVQEDRRWFAQVDADTEFVTRSILTLPLLRQNRVLGVLQVINKCNGAPFNEDDQQLLLAFAGQSVVALENARLLASTDQALQKSVEELSLLQQLDRDLNTTLDLDHVLNLTLDRMLNICQGTAGCVVIVDEDRQPQLRVYRGYDKEFLDTIDELNLTNTGLVGQVIRTGKPHVTGNVHEEAHYVAASFATHSQVTLPFLHKQRLIGVIAVESDRLDAFDPVTVETAVRVANHASVAIANAILYEKVHEANQAKSEFVSMVSHELKTPMTAVRGFVDLLLSGMAGDLTPRQKGFLETIAANVRRMGQQIQDLTDISRIEMNRLHVDITPTAFATVLSETMHTIQPLCDEKNIHLQVEMPDDLPLVLADKARLVQVMTNLLSNACKYSPPDTEVRVSLQPEMNSSKPVVQCAVQDQGYGISEEDQARLFTKFFRSDDPNVRQSKGTGLGLSITKGIVELMNGRIWVESKLGQGATFYFTVPQVESS